MDKLLLIKSCIDYDGGIKRFSGKADIYDTYLQKFVTDEGMRMLRAAVEAGDVKESFVQAHTLYGTVSNLGIDAMSDTLKPIVEKLREDSIDGVAKLLDTLDVRYKTVIDAINTAYCA